MKEEINKALNTIGQSTSIILEPAKQRMANPIIGSFVITFIALNWKPIIFLLFSSKTIEEKLAFFKNEFYGHQWWDFGMYIGFPILITLLYVIVIPLFLEWIEEVLYFTKKNKYKREYELHYEQQKDQENIALAQYKAEEARTGLVGISKLTEDNDKLKEQIKAEKEKVESLSNQNIEHVNNLNVSGTKIKEIESENKGLELEIQRLLKSNESKDLKINELDKTVEDKNKGVENLYKDIEGLNKMISSLSGEIGNKNQIISDLNLDRSRIQSEYEVIKSQSDFYMQENTRMQENYNVQIETNNQLSMEKVNWESSYNNLLSLHEAQSNRLSQFENLEANFTNLTYYLQQIQAKLGLTESQDFHNIIDMRDFVDKMVNFLAILNSVDINQTRPSSSFHLTGIIKEDLSKDQFTNQVFTIAQSLGVSINDIFFGENDYVQIIYVLYDYVTDGFFEQISSLFVSNSINSFQP